MTTVVIVVGVILLLVLILLPVFSLVRRAREGGEAVAGGSFGRQLGRKKDDWGPKPTARR